MVVMCHLSIPLLYDAFSCPYFRFDVVMPQMKAMALDVQPLLAEVRDSGLLKEVESLTRSLTLASDDLRSVA
jgi:hypothetical protein